MLRIRSPTGTSSLQISLSDTLSQLRATLHSTTNIPSSRQELRFGFPPKLITELGSATLESIGIRNGDPVIVAETTDDRPESPAPPTPAPAPPAMKNDTLAATVKGEQKPVESVEVDGGYLVLRVVPDDNSCLFTSVGIVLEPGRPNVVATLRQLIATTIDSSPDTYSEAFLGQPPDSYIATITSPSSWGGAIELAIFAESYGKEIWSIDVQSGRVDKFGEGSGYDEVVFVVYSGIHYDALTFSYAPPTPSSEFPPPNLEFDTTVFPSSTASSSILAAAQQLVNKLRKEHNYTDITTFTLKCEICKTAIVGEKEAKEHAKETGHQKFGEYDG